MKPSLSDSSLAQLFVDARTYNGFGGAPVSNDLLRKIYELARMGPTAANTVPLRIAFVVSKEAKERLRPALDAGNVDKTMKAPVTAILAYDSMFHEHTPRLFPNNVGAKGWFADDTVRENVAKLNSSIQIGYFLLAARSLGLDCGPMGGFSRPKVDEAFFANSTWRSSVLCNLGEGDDASIFPRNPRLSFEEACKVL
mgnify:CR=1 FL=1